MGIVELGKIDWNGVEFDDVVNDIYNECIHSERNENAIIWVRFENWVMWGKMSVTVATPFLTVALTEVA